VQSAWAARRLVRTALCAWGLNALEDDGTLVVAELVANAAQHTTGPMIRVSVSRQVGGLVRIDVADHSRKRPERRETNEYTERGRGLALVEGLAERWGTDLLPSGKRVWAVLAAEPTA